MRTPRLARRVIGALLVALLMAGPANASTPESHAVTAPAEDGETVRVSWTGVVPPGANLASTCVDAPVSDEHTIELTVPAGAYATFNVAAVFSLTSLGASDLIITVIGPGGAAISADGGSVGAAESVKMADPAPGTYRIVACAWAGAVDQYTGSLELTASAIGQCPSDVAYGIDFQEATIPDLQSAMASGSLTSRQLVDAYLRRIQLYNTKVNAIRALNPGATLEAEALDAERVREGPRGPMHGIPVLLKDNVGTTHMPTTAGSIALEDSIPLREAFLVTQLQKAGAIILGKLNLSEFANWVDLSMPSGYSSLGGQVRNAYHFGDPSGSSSGSGVAASLAFAAATIGTETSGSILSPSVFNSVVGIKTTVGLVSRAGIIPLAPTYDVPGPMTRTVTDAAIVLGAIAGVDARDPATSGSDGNAKTDYRPFLRADGLKGARIGVSSADRDGLGDAAAALFDAAVAKLQLLGATIITADSLSNTRTAGLTEIAAIPNEFKASLNSYLASETPATLRVRTLKDIEDHNAQHPDKMKYGQKLITISNATLGMMDGPDAIAIRAVTINGAQTVIDDTFAENDLDAFLTPNNVNANIGAAAQYPSIAVPAGFVGKDQPFGITLLGRAYDEPKLISYAYAYENATNLRVPPTKVNTALCPPRAQAKRPAVLGERRTRPPTAGSLPATGIESASPFAAFLLLASVVLIARRRFAR